MNKITRRSFLSAAAAFGAAWAVAACSNAPSTPNATPAAGSQPSSGTKAVSIRMMAGSYTPVKQSDVDVDPPQYMAKLVTDYTKQKPGFSVDWVVLNNAGQNDTDVWIRTQLAAGTPPEIINWQTARMDPEIGKGIFTVLDPILDKPNPYVSGNKRWLDNFNPLMMEGKRLSDGHQYVVPIDLIATGIIYNKELFDKAKVGVPKTWAEMQANNKKILDAGIVPMDWWMQADVSRWQWTFACLQDVLLDSEMDKIAGRKTKRGAAADITKKELVQAIKRGDYSGKDPQYKEILKVFKDWTPYFTPGFVGIKSDDGYRAFVNGQAAAVWQSSGGYRNIKRDKARKFDTGLFYLPLMTKETSQYAPGNLEFPFVGGPTATQWSIPTAAKDKTDGIVDWLMYISAPQNAGPLIEDYGGYAPNIVNATVNPDIKFFMDIAERGTFRIFNDLPLTPEYKDKHNRIGQLLLSGGLTVDQAAEQIQKEMEIAADALIKDNPDWAVKS